MNDGGMTNVSKLGSRSLRFSFPDNTSFPKNLRGGCYLWLCRLLIRRTVRISLRRRPVLRDRVFTAVLAGALAHGIYLVYPFRIRTTNFSGVSAVVVPISRYGEEVGVSSGRRIGACGSGGVVLSFRGGVHVRNRRHAGRVGGSAATEG
ncbi:hypothetical protein PHJA_000086500 [Phtheirospermum japonicum]|uniref:Uncharacterized protein n=1 Tax=Phtheirospermum japonicum TaxID=374723 RepID=A0A830AXL1_9LAMI|nr:hypothetical protein PHJA_000086500 [Phtheirospermum japonicum]